MSLASASRQYYGIVSRRLYQVQALARTLRQSVNADGKGALSIYLYFHLIPTCATKADIPLTPANTHRPGRIYSHVSCPVQPPVGGVRRSAPAPAHHAHTPVAGNCSLACGSPRAASQDCLDATANLEPDSKRQCRRSRIPVRREGSQRGVGPAEPVPRMRSLHVVNSQSHLSQSQLLPTANKLLCGS